MGKRNIHDFTRLSINLGNDDDSPIPVITLQKNMSESSVKKKLRHFRMIFWKDYIIAVIGL